MVQTRVSERQIAKEYKTGSGRTHKSKEKYKFKKARLRHLYEEQKGKQTPQKS